ncbi:MAG: LolA family protein [Acidimicrobiales bacterium]
MAPSARQRRLRWAAPLGVAAVIALIVAVPGLSAANTADLPPLTPAQLVAKVEQANVSHLSGTLNLTTSLGIPNLSELSQAATSGGGAQSEQAFDPTSLLSGSHKALVWFDGQGRSRADLLESMAEFDVIHNGTDVWTWDSVSKQAAHYTMSEQAGTATQKPDTTTTPPEVETPQQLADKILAQVDPTTLVSVGPALKVADHDAYQLVLTPRSAASTVDHVAIAVDKQSGLPTQVAIFAKGQKAVALQLGFGQINLAMPSASEFNFTPPAGATVTNGSAHSAAAGTTSPATHPGTVRGALGLKGSGSAKAAGAAPAAPATISAGATAAPSKPQTIGTGWTAVKVYSQVQIPAQFQQYLAAGTAVSGSFGTGKLLQTSLVNVLVLDNGKVAVGAVNAAALEAAAAAAA